MATAKQLAARRKFARIMKSGGFKKRKTQSGRPKSAKKSSVKIITNLVQHIEL